MEGKSPKNGEGMPKRGNMIRDNQILYNNPKSTKHVNGMLNITLPNDLHHHRAKNQQRNLFELIKSVPLLAFFFPPSLDGMLNIALPNEGSWIGL